MAQYSITKFIKKPANITTSWENKKLLKICFHAIMAKQMKTNKLLDLNQHANINDLYIYIII